MATLPNPQGGPPQPTSQAAPIVNTQFNPILNQSHIGTFNSVSGGPQWLTPPSSPPKGWNEIDGYQEQFGVDASAATRLFRGPWITRFDFVQWALGFTYSVPNQNMPNQGQLVRFLPAQHPEFPWLFAVDVRLVRGEGAYANNPYVGAQDECGNVTRDPATNYATPPIPMICYFDQPTGSDANSCIYAVEYQALDYEVRDASFLPNGEMSRWTAKTVTFSNKTQNIPGGWLKWADGTPGTLAESGTLIFGTLELTYRWRQVPDVPWVAIQNCIGGVNLNPFDGDGGYPTFPPQTLLCLSPEVERHRGPTGRIMWDIIYKFFYSPVGHNSFPRRDTQGNFQGYFPMTFDGTTNGKTLYPIVDFAQLWVPPLPANYQTLTGLTSACP